MDYTILIIGGIAIVAILGTWLVLSYRRLQASENTADSAWESLKDAIADRFDAINEIVEFAKFQRNEELGRSSMRVLNSYSQAYKNDKPEEAGKAEKIFMNDTIPLLASSIRSSGDQSQVRALRNTISSTDETLKKAQRKYNEEALKHNNVIAQFPLNLIASIVRIGTKEVFLAPEDTDKQHLNLRFE